MPFSFSGALIFKWQQLGSALLSGKGVASAFLKMQTGVGEHLSFFFFFLFFCLGDLAHVRKWNPWARSLGLMKAAPGPGFQALFSGCRVRRGWGQTWGRAAAGGQHVAGDDSRLSARRPRCCNWSRRRGARVSLGEADTMFFVGLRVVNGFFTHSLPGIFFFFLDTFCSHICPPWCVRWTAERTLPYWGLQG